MTVDAALQTDRAVLTGGGVRVDWAPVPRVNLLPSEILDARAFRRVQRALVGGVAATLVVGAAAFAWSLHEVSTAQTALDASRARTVQLHTEEAKYADVPRVLAQVEGAKTARTTALSADVLWYRFFDDLAAATPDTVALTSVTVGLGSAGSSDLLTPSGIGTVTFDGGGEHFPDVSSWLESVAGVDGLDGSTLQSATRTSDGGPEGRVSFTSKIVIDGSALSHRYDGKAG